MSERPSHIRYVVLFGLCLIAGLAYIHRGCFGGAETTIRAALELSEHQTGSTMSIFYVTYALFQIPMGLVVDRRGARFSMFVFGMMGALTMAMSAGTLFFHGMAGLAVLMTSQLLMGVAQAGLFPASTRCIATWFPLRDRAFAAGTLQACMSIGGAINFFLLGYLLAIVYWPWLFVIFAVPGVAWSIWFYAWYRNRPADHRSVNEAERELLKTPAHVELEAEPLSRTPWLKLATRPKLLWLCASQFFRAGANVFWLTWCATYLQQAFHADKGLANQLTGIPFLGVVIGSYGGGVLADRVLARTGSKRKSRNGVAITTAAIGVGFFILAWLTSAGPYAAIALLFLAAVLVSGGNPCAYSVTIDIGGRHMAVVFGAMNMLGNFGAALFPIILPLWTGEFGWLSVPLLMSFLYFLGVFCWCFVDPNGTILEKQSG